MFAIPVDKIVNLFCFPTYFKKGRFIISPEAIFILFIFIDLSNLALEISKAEDKNSIFFFLEYVIRIL